MPCATAADSWSTLVDAADDLKDVLLVLGTVASATLAIWAVVRLALVPFLSGRVTPLQRFVVFGPVRRRAARALRRAGATARVRRRVRRETSAYLQAAAEDRPALPADLVAALQTRGADPAVDFRSLEQAAAVLRCLRDAGRLAASPGGRSTLARLLWPELAGATLAALEALDAHLTSFVDLDGVAAHDPSDLASAVQDFVGVLVLADGTGNRSRVIDDLVVWHRNAWSGPADPHGPAMPPDTSGFPAPTPYALAHAGVDETRLTDLDEPVRRRPGDYDGRIFDLRSVSVRTNTVTQAPTVVLETTESCYAVSERSPASRCKHLTSTSDLSAPPGAPWFEAGAGGRTRRTSDGEPARVLLLNTCVTLVSLHDPARPRIVLARRAHNSNNANGVVSATSGGVFEHRRGAQPGDVDPGGMPSPRVSARREAYEELGVPLKDSQLQPVCVFVATTQGRPAGTGAERRSHGQLVATVSFVGYTELGVEELNLARAVDSDWSSGRFELSHLVTLDLPSCEVHGTERAADLFFEGLGRRLAELDQNATLSALYLAAQEYGPEAVSTRLRSSPTTWWQTPWAGDPDGPPRVVCLPEHLGG